MRGLSSMVLVALTCSGAAVAAPWVVAPPPHGQVRFKVEGPLDDVIGETGKVTGTLEVDEKDLGKSKGLVAVQLDSLKTGIDQRDQDMRHEFLEVDKNPFALLQIDRIDRPSSPTLIAGQDVQGEAVGSFEVHGVRREIRMPVTLRLTSATVLTVRGAFEVPFADYKIERPKRLFIKLGDTADASFDVLFNPRAGAAPAPAVAKGEPIPPAAPTVAAVLPPAPKAKPRPVKKADLVLTTATLFKGDDARARGEEIFHSVKAGGLGNRLTCGHCHAKTDERQGFKQADGYAREAGTLWNSAQRSKFWGGMTTDIGKAASICQRKFMRGEGLGGTQEGQLKAFLVAISPDPAPDFDSGDFYRTLESPLPNPIAGDAVKGQATAEVYCGTCHKEGRRDAPILAKGLYEPEWIVRRLRWLEGHQSKGCPPISRTRLPDSDLRDIVSYLSGPKAGEPIFKRATK